MAQDDDKAVEALLLNVHPTRRALLKRMLVAAGALALALPVSSAFAEAQGKGKGKGKGKGEGEGKGNTGGTGPT